MGGINFKEVNSLIALVQALDEALSGMQADAVSREEEVRLASESWMEEASARSLEEIRSLEHGDRGGSDPADPA